jgi:hypothetical protein
MKINNKIMISFVISVAGIMTSSYAFADGCDAFSSGGFLANIAECASGQNSAIGQAAQAADRLNGQMGRPVDNAIYNGVNAIYPGAGTAMGAYATMQNNGMIPQVQAPQPQCSYIGNNAFGAPVYNCN